MRLKIRLRHLSALEEGRWEDIPGEVYARGFFRAYADFLGLDGPGLLRELEEPAPQPGPREERGGKAEELKGDRVSGGRRSRTIFGLLLLALGVGVLLAGLYLPSHPGSRAPEPVPGSPGELRKPPSGGPPSEPGSPSPPGAQGAPPSPSETASSAPGPSPDASPWSPARREGNRFFFVLPSGELTLAGEFSAPCWLRVEADGRRIFEGTIPAGGKGEWKASRRLTVRVGNPPGASFRVGGRMLSLPPEKRPVDLEITAE